MQPHCTPHETNPRSEKLCQPRRCRVRRNDDAIVRACGEDIAGERLSTRNRYPGFKDERREQHRERPQFLHHRGRLFVSGQSRVFEHVEPSTAVRNDLRQRRSGTRTP